MYHWSRLDLGNGAETLGGRPMMLDPSHLVTCMAAVSISTVLFVSFWLALPAVDDMIAANRSNHDHT